MPPSLFSFKGRVEGEPRAAHVRFAARTEKGPHHPRNEDAYVVDALEPAPFGTDRVEVGARGVLLAVADGMGGEGVGEVASAMTLDGVRRLLRDVPPRAIGPAALGECVCHTHAALSRWMDTFTTSSDRRGATLSAVLVHRGEAILAHVGDSRVYLVRAGSVLRLTHDQTMMQALFDAGLVSGHQARVSPLRNVLLQAVGQDRPLEVALSRVSLRDRDCLVICSDGITDVVADHEIEGIVCSSSTLQLATDRLVDLARGRGSSDDVTAILAGVSGDLPMADLAEPFGASVEVVHPYTVGKVSGLGGSAS